MKMLLWLLLFSGYAIAAAPIICDINGDGKDDAICLEKDTCSIKIYLKVNNSIIDSFDRKVKLYPSEIEKEYEGVLRVDGKDKATAVIPHYCSVIVHVLAGSSILYLWNVRKYTKLWLTD